MEDWVEATVGEVATVEEEVDSEADSSQAEVDEGFERLGGATRRWTRRRTRATRATRARRPPGDEEYGQKRAAVVLPDDARIKVVAFVVFLRRRRRRLCVVVDVDDRCPSSLKNQRVSLSLTYLISLAAAFDTTSLCVRKKQRGGKTQPPLSSLSSSVVFRLFLFDTRQHTTPRVLRERISSLSLSVVVRATGSDLSV